MPASATGYVATNATIKWAVSLQHIEINININLSQNENNVAKRCFEVMHRGKR
jgi:hypothetical protein